MQADPVEEWRRLATLYSEMSDVEIRELADQSNDLTPTAQEVLRDEMNKRGLKARGSIGNTSTSNGNHAAVRWDPREDTETNRDGDSQENEACDYTWKTALYRCDSMDEAAQRCEMLRRAGIESWVQRPGSRFVIPWVDELGVGDIQINVAADQLDQARVIVAQPIPRDIIDEMKEIESAPVYELPVCPKCGTADPTLESVDPSNNWLCESCGYTWSDPSSDPTSSAQTVD